MATRKRRNGQETSLSRAIQQALTARGAWVIRVQAGVVPALYGTTKRFIHLAEPGCPDLIVMSPSGNADAARFVWLEVKTKTGRLSKEQLFWHAKASTRGVTARVVRSITDAFEAVFGGGK